jgi:hypothetical protein
MACKPVGLAMVFMATLCLQACSDNSVQPSENVGTAENWMAPGRASWTHHIPIWGLTHSERRASDVRAAANTFPVEK